MVTSSRLQLNSTSKSINFPKQMIVRDFQLMQVAFFPILKNHDIAFWTFLCKNVVMTKLSTVLFKIEFPTSRVPPSEPTGVTAVGGTH